MTWEMLFVFVLLAAAFGMMLWERFSLDVVAMTAFSALLATQILTPAEAFRVFSNDAAITVGCMFILSAALQRTGLIESIGRRMDRWVGQSEISMLLVLLPLVALVSAFINNTPVVVVLMPIMISLAASRGIKPSKLLIPLSFASILGGTCTLIGTSTNILVSATARSMGQRPIEMFELGKIGLILTGAGIAYLLFFGRKLLPARETLASILQTTDSKEYLTEAVVMEKSPLIGKKLLDTPLADRTKARIIEVVRGGTELAVPLNEVVLQAGDRLRLAITLSDVMDLSSLGGVEILPKAKLGVEVFGAQKAAIVECVIAPRSRLVGRSIRQVNFRRRYGVLVLAVHRKGENLREDFADVKLQYGDTLLIEGPEATVNEMRGKRDFLMLVDVPHTPKRRRKQGAALATVAGVVGLAALDVMPIAALAILGAVAVVLMGCVTIEEAYDAIDWEILFLIFGMLALGAALEKTRGADLIAQTLISGLGNLGPIAVLSAIILLASLMTNFLSNNAVAVLLTPIVIQAATALGVSARPFLIAVAIGASACFSSPVGYQTNTLVYGAGGYMFRDFIKIGLPLNLLIWLLASWWIPVFWPFHPVE